MPLINYSCPCGKVLKKYQKSPKEAPAFVQCDGCGAEAKKSFGATSSSTKITIDNGLMARRIDVDENIMQINDERSAKDFSEE